MTPFNVTGSQICNCLKIQTEKKKINDARTQCTILHTLTFSKSLFLRRMFPMVVMHRILASSLDFTWKILKSVIRWGWRKKKEGTTTSKHQQNKMLGSKKFIYAHYTILHLHYFSKPQDAFCSIIFQSKCTYQCLHDSDQFKQNASPVH